jgi:hypothetical protein
MAFVRSSLELKNWNGANKRGEFLFQSHEHYSKNILELRFGKKDTFCVTRNWFERWLSALRFFWLSVERNGMTPIIKYEDIDNEFIYEIFNKKFSDTLNFAENGWVLCTEFLIKENAKNLVSDRIKRLSHLFLSQNYWKNNEKCTYEFNIKKLDELENFIFDRFGVKIEITENNVTLKKIKNKIVIDENFKNHIWNMFEKPFSKNKKVLL